MKQIKKSGVKMRGFTLIEILVVLGIIGVLASSVTVTVVDVKKRARDSKRISELNQIAQLLNFFSIDSGSDKYPDSLDVLVPKYTKELPKDPLTGENYFYCASGTSGGINDGAAFHLAAALEEYNQNYFGSDSDLERDYCENLTGNPSFNGYSDACSGSQKCNGENCDGCLDFSNIASSGGGSSGSGGSGGGTNPSKPVKPTNVAVELSGPGKATLSWSPENSNGFMLKITGNFWMTSGPVYATTAMYVPTNSYIITGLTSKSQYFFTVEAIGPEPERLLSEPSEQKVFIAN